MFALKLCRANAGMLFTWAGRGITCSDRSCHLHPHRRYAVLAEAGERFKTVWKTGKRAAAVFTFSSPARWAAM